MIYLVEIIWLCSLIMGLLSDVVRDLIWVMAFMACPLGKEELLEYIYPLNLVMHIVITRIVLYDAYYFCVK